MTLRTRFKVYQGSEVIDSADSEDTRLIRRCKKSVKSLIRLDWPFKSQNLGRELQVGKASLLLNISRKALKTFFAISST